MPVLAIRLVVIASLGAFALVSPGSVGLASAAVSQHAAGASPHSVTATKPLPLVSGRRLDVARPANMVRIQVHRGISARSVTHSSAASAPAAPSAPFTECPAVGLDTSCEILVQVTDHSFGIIGDPSQGPFDGSDDTLIGVLNSSSDTINSLQLSSDTDLFGFDGDGLCTQSPAPAACPFGPTGYEGPGTSFSNITPDSSGGVVNFSGGLAPGQTAYFSLEEALSATTVIAGGPGPSEQGGPANLSENPTTCSTARPVNCATGVFWHQFTDFAVPGRGVALNFSRTYASSQASVDGPFGFGWTDSYAMSLSTDASGNVTVAQEDGSTVTFQPNGAGGFTAPPRVLATLAENSDGSFTFVRDQGQTQYNFSAVGQLTSEVDRNGYQTDLAYNAQGQVTSVTDPAGRKLTFTYTGSQVTAATDPMGRTWSYAYDADGNLVGATDPAGRTWSFTYDPGHQLLTMTDPRGGVTANTYNASGQVTAQVDPDAGKTTWSYSGDPTSAAGGSTTMTDPIGNITTYDYANLELASVTHGAGTAQSATTSYAYDPATLGVTSVTDPNGNVTTSTYDSSGNLLSKTDPLGNTTSYSYNSFAETLSKTSPLGETTSYAYDATGNLVGVSDPLGNGTSYAYNDGSHPGDVTSATDPDGNVIGYAYDADGDVASVSLSPSSGVTDTTAYAYDEDGERTCAASPNATAAHVSCPAAGSPPAADTTATAYNADGEVTSVTDPDGHLTRYAYDSNGNQAQVTDPAGHVTSYAYNGDDHQAKVTRPDGSTLTSAYDADNNLTSQTNAAGGKTTYAYDALSRLTSATNPLGATTSYAYDAAGNRTSTTDPLGRRTSDSYDGASELTGVSYSDGSTPDVSYAYDADGQRSGTTDGTGTTSYSYDSDGRLTAVTNGAGATVSDNYDPAGHVTSLAYPDGNTVTRSYDGAGRLASVSDWLGHTTRFSYDPNGNLLGEAYPNGVTAASAFDDADQLKSIIDKTSSATVASFTYSRDSLGQVTSVAQGGTLTGTQDYSYGQLSQLTSDGSGQYGYDSAGDLTALPGHVTQAFNAGGELTSTTKPATAAAPATDEVASANETTKAAKLTSPAVSTKNASELILAFISADGPASRTQRITGVAGGSLKWSLAVRSNTHRGTAEVWQAHATKKLAAAKITATLALRGFDGSITVAAFTGAASAVGAHAAGGAASGAPTVSLKTTGANSVVWAAGQDWDHAKARTAARGQTVVHQYLDTRVSNTYWTQRTPAVAAAATTVKVADTAPTADRWELAAVEIKSAATGSQGKVSYSYDQDGNRTKAAPSGAAATTLTYDQANRLTADGSGARYAYDGDGLRMSKTVGGTTTAFAWDQSGSLPLVLAAGSISYVYGPGGQPVEQVTGSTVTYLLADGQGSTRLLANSAGAIVGTYSYGSYGAVTSHTGSATTALQYDGQYTDAESGFQYLQDRYYDPSTGQFLTGDPAELLSAMPYGYAANNPVSFSDPTGLLCASWHCIQDSVLPKVAAVSGFLQTAADITILGGVAVGIVSLAIAGPAGLVVAIPAFAIAEQAVAYSEAFGTINLLATCGADPNSDECANSYEIAHETGGFGTGVPETLSGVKLLYDTAEILADRFGEWLLSSHSAPESPGYFHC